MALCSVDDCLANGESKRGGLCAGHAKAKEQGRPMRELAERHRSRMQRLIAAALHLADVDGFDALAWERAKDRLRKAASAYCR